jgi:hypothetical protein
MAISEHEYIKLTEKRQETPVISSLLANGVSYRLMVKSEEYKTTPCIIDYLKRHLAGVIQKSELEDRKYYLRALSLLNMGAMSPTPIFYVDASDLSIELLEDLNELDVTTKDFVLKQSVGRIFEDINPELYHNSISKVLRVKLSR